MNVLFSRLGLIAVMLALFLPATAMGQIHVVENGSTVVDSSVLNGTTNTVGKQYVAVSSFVDDSGSTSGCKTVVESASQAAMIAQDRSDAFIRWFLPVLQYGATNYMR